MEFQFSGNTVNNTPPKIYHETQRLQLCGLHALNNLFQDGNAFTKKDLDNICTRLCPKEIFNPYRSTFAVGNYDINVLMVAVQSKGYDMLWFNKTRNLKCLVLENIEGFILNIPCGNIIMKLISQGKHWITIRKISNVYYSLDSNNKAPVEIGSDDELLVHLCEQLNNNHTELFLIVTPDVDKNKSWFRQLPPEEEWGNPLTKPLDPKKKKSEAACEAEDSSDTTQNGCNLI
ncbi:josephin-1 [Octopus bimaculoides]|uniref:ubiquitinyl hydrolase 1 n=1 Tax=Octopus bimaculoides TaxID=37653 RepID=A0A0L8H0W2_OCTBM|nr:josephin-1 [Octopus bimaculoides]XP_014776704.1 josephin-1 [Octopus bimaculoides]XP_014776705.1 josephin-1 [Octopus bimaculoides]XP_014776706.1 josephin-1 [Octopus bimaculoides]|eukprot:XP_014776703.1 PREDICTED: josephin-1-like [Octopus bimaculoides]